MKILIICILKLIYISTVSSEGGSLCHVCEYVGYDPLPLVDLQPTAADVPKRCDLVTYGYYYFDGVGLDDINMYKHDEAAIKSMVAAGLPVYTYVSYNGTDKWTEEIFEPKDPATYDKLICPLIQKMNELKPTGIILGIIDIYDGADLANKIKAFITKIKPQLPNFKFGLGVSAVKNFKNLPNKKLFDYSVTNSIVDLYFIDMNINTYTCTKELSCEGTPLTSPDKNKLTLESLSIALSQSGIDIAKSIPCFNIVPIVPDHSAEYNPYSKYCDDLGAARAQLWCLDKSQRLYDMGALMKKHKFPGVGVDWMEWDDIEGACQCDKFLVSNLIFDGYDGKPIKPCAKLG